MERRRKKVNETKQEWTEKGNCTKSYGVDHKEIAEEMEGKNQDKAREVRKETPLARIEKGEENLEVFRKRMRRNEIMKAIVRRVDRKDALDLLCAY